MFIYLEGVDGSGKSTLAKQLAAQHDLRILHRGPIPANRTFRQEYLDDVKKQLPGLVLDRGPISERVYGLFYRKEVIGGLEDWAEVLRYYESQQVIKIYLHAPTPVLAYRIGERGEEVPYAEDLEALHELYMRTIDDTWIVWDTSLLPPQEIRELLKG